MGFCAYNGSPDRLAQLVKVNIWNINLAILLKIAKKIIRNQPLTRNDLDEMRHQGTNYDALLKSMDVTSEMHKFFQAIATDKVVKALKEQVLNTENPTLLSQYLEIESEIQQIEAHLNQRGQRIAQLNQRLSQRKQELLERDEELSQLQHAIAALREQLQQQEKAQLLEKPQHKQAAASSQVKAIQQQLWTMLCAGVVCGLVLGVVGTTAMANRPLRTGDAVALPTHIQ